MSPDESIGGDEALTRESALMLLASKASHNRFRAARALIKWAAPGDIKLLMAAKRSESDAVVKRWIDLAIAAGTRKSIEEASASFKNDEGVDVLDSRIKTQAIEWVAGVLLHEIGSKIGLLVGSAAREFPGYTGSTTEKHATNLIRILEGVAELKKATSVPKAQEFDLSTLIDEIISVEMDGSDLDISVVGRKPLMLLTDPDLLRLALCNGIRNAIEAVAGGKERGNHQVVITWEVTDKEFWVSVLDDGPGLVGPIGSAFEVGRTNKVGHAGFGLSIARQAMEMLGGTVRLAPSAGGGAAFEVRGALINENSNRRR